MRDKLYIVKKTVNAIGRVKIQKFRPALTNNHGRCMDFNTKNIKRGIR